jgi:hypothetical protein
MVISAIWLIFHTVWANTTKPFMISAPHDDGHMARHSGARCKGDAMTAGAQATASARAATTGQPTAPVGSNRLSASIICWAFW